MIEFLRQTGSTNAELVARLRGGSHVPEDQWLVTDRQTDGRGRQGRSWFDSAGNFMGSVLVRLCHGDPSPGSLALVAGLAVIEALGTRVPPPHRALLKWPNDVLIGPAKLCGILLEREGDAVIVGVGVNLAQAPQVEGRQTVALSAFGPAPDRDSFAADLAQSFTREVYRWRTFGLEPLVRRWLEAAHPIGTLLRVGDSAETQITGTFAGLSGEGALQLRLADGTTQTFHAGDVHLAGE